MILDCITHDINPPTPTPQLCPHSVPTPYLVCTLFSDWSRSFLLLSLKLWVWPCLNFMRCVILLGVDVFPP